MHHWTDTQKEVLDGPEFKALFDYECYMAAAGLYFGYRLCCIKEFFSGFQSVEGLQRRHTIFRKLDKMPLLNGSGFVPCEACIKTLKNAPAIYQYFENRICPKPFPEQTSEGKQVEFVAQVFLYQHQGNLTKAKKHASTLSRPEALLKALLSIAKNKKK